MTPGSLEPYRRLCRCCLCLQNTPPLRAWTLGWHCQQMPVFLPEGMARRLHNQLQALAGGEGEWNTQGAPGRDHTVHVSCSPSEMPLPLHLSPGKDATITAILHMQKSLWPPVGHCACLHPTPGQKQGRKLVTTESGHTPAPHSWPPGKMTGQFASSQPGPVVLLALAKRTVSLGLQISPKSHPSRPLSMLSSPLDMSSLPSLCPQVLSSLVRLCSDGASSGKPFWVPPAEGPSLPLGCLPSPLLVLGNPPARILLPSSAGLSWLCLPKGH